MEQVLAGRFELIDQIGKGGMGSVWRAWDRKAGRLIAAKVLGHHDGQILLRFVREQSVRIQHPHVVSPHGWAADDDRVVLAMDLVRGGSLDTLLGDAGALPDSYAAVLVDQVLQALEGIHAAEVVHRDIKPANLLLEVTGTRWPHLRVSDFGIALVANEPRLTQTAMSIGTLGYLSPEQAAGAEPDPVQDLFAVGVVGRQLVTGLRPKDQPTDHPSALWPLLRQLSATDPRQRPSSATEARSLLAGLVPSGASWLELPEPPEVFDQLGPPYDRPAQPPQQIPAQPVQPIPRAAQPIPEPVEGPIPGPSQPLPEPVEGQRPSGLDQDPTLQRQRPTGIPQAAGTPSAERVGTTDPRRRLIATVAATALILAAVLLVVAVVLIIV